MGSLVRIALIFLALILSSVRSEAQISSQGSSEQAESAPSTDGKLIDQRVQSSFAPTVAYLFSSQLNGSVRNRVAAVVPALSGAGDYVVGTVLPESDSESLLYYTFFLRGRDSSFAATPVRRVERAQFDSRSQAEIEKKTAEISAAHSHLERELKELKTKLQNQRDQAIKLTGVDDLMQLQTELNKLESSEQRRTGELSRLQELIKTGRKLGDPEDIDAIKQQLSSSLRDIAQATALSDRLKDRKIKAARDILRERLALIKGMSGYNRDELAREIISLRSTRKKLESSVGRRTGTERIEEN